MTKERWEFRVNNIRSSGDTFASYDDAVRRMFKELDKLHFDAPSDRDHNGRKESELIAVYARAKRQRPLGDITLKAFRNGKPWVLQVNRLPWGQSPMIGNHTI